MLKSLSIKNYAIIDNLNIDFDNGFNAFVGETGSGKSIIVGALSFLLKGRSDSSIIQKGKDKTIIEGVFDIKDETILNKLTENDIELEDYIIVRRTISIDNKNSIKINDTNVTLNFLQDLFKDYVDIHSQKENNYLYNRKNQLKLLDKFANNSELLTKYKKTYDIYSEKKNIYEDLANNKYSDREFEFLSFDLKELEEANLSVEEKESLENDEIMYKSSAKIIESLNNIVDGFDNVEQSLSSVKNLSNNLKNINELDETNSNLEDTYYNLKDISDKYRQYRNKIKDKDIDIDYVESRLYTYSKLERKYKKTVEELISYIDEIKTKLDFYANKEETLAIALKELNDASKECEKLATDLNKSRLKASKLIKDSLIANGKELNLLNLNFEVGFEKIELGIDGFDSIDFKVSLNKNEDLKSLKDVASGGESSRLMLLLKEIFSKQNNIGLLIFDEIDTGISGVTALAVGKKIRNLSKYSQIFCISHLAPVVACADHHYLIYKQDSKTETNTFIKKLDEENTIKQIAIMSNSSDDANAIKAAKDLIKHSKE